MDKLSLIWFLVGLVFGLGIAAFLIIIFMKPLDNFTEWIADKLKWK